MRLSWTSTRLTAVRLLLLVASLLTSYGGKSQELGGYVATAPTQEKIAARELTPLQPSTQLLSRETPHTYRIALLPDQYVSVLVTKGDANLRLTIAEPKGQTLREFVSRRFGPLHVSFIALIRGDYLLEVRAPESDEAASEYTLVVEEVRAATGTDRKVDGAVSAYAEAERLRAEWTADSSRAAVERYVEAASRWQAAARPREASGALLDAGDTFFALSEYGRALDFYKQALSVSRAASDGHGVMQALNRAGYVHVNTDNNGRALLYFRRVRDFYSKGRAAARPTLEDQREVAQVNNNLGEVYYYRGDFTKAKEYFNRALQMQAKTGDRRGQALAHLNLGYMYSDSGDLYNSLAHISHSLKLWRAVGDLRGEAHSNRAHGMVLTFQGETQDAFDAYKRALQLFRVIGDRQGEAAALNSLGKIYEDLNEPQVALDNYTLALKLFQQSGNSDAEAVTRYYVGRAYQSLKDPRALEYYGQCLAQSRALGKRRVENYALVGIASMHATGGRKPQALEGYGKALRFYRRMADRRGQAYVLSSIGDVYFASADQDRALDVYRRALALSREAGDHRGETSMLYKVARAERDHGDMEQALASIKEALRISESLRTKVVRKDLRSSFFASVNDQYALYIDLLMQLHRRYPSGDFAAAALQASESARARTLLETLADARVGVQRGVAPELLERERTLQQALAAKAERQVLLRVASGHDAESEELEVETRRLTTEYQEVRAEVMEQGLRNATLVQPVPLRLDEIQSTLLDDDMILLEYSLGEERSYLWAVTAHSFSSHTLPPRSEIESLAHEVYRLLAESEAKGPGPSAPGQADSPDAVYWKTAAVMSRMLLRDVAAQLKGKRLLVVPDGALQYIPFDALPVPTEPSADAGEPVPLVVEHEIVRLPSVSTLVALRRREARSKANPEKLVVVLADPVFERDDPRFQHGGDLASQTAQAAQVEAMQLRASLRAVERKGQDSTLSRLPFTLQEANAIMAVAPADGRAMITGFAASRESVVGGGLRDYRIVHLATHSVINSRHPELTGIVLTMLNERGTHENGFLQLHDIYGLDLSANLVVLSACSTGLGEDIRGEGLVGLTQGFLYAGTDSVVASLWKVDDRATAELMQHFYRAMLQEGLTPAAALRAAKQSMWRERRWRSPYYWAAFVLQGDYRQPVKPATTRTSGVLKLSSALIFLFALLFTTVLWRKRRRRSVSVPLRN